MLAIYIFTLSCHEMVWILRAQLPVREAAANGFHVLDVLIDEAVEGDQLADNREAEFKNGRPELTQLNNGEHVSHLHCSDDDFHHEGDRERDHGVEHLLFLDFERVGLVQSDLIELANQVDDAD